MSRIRRTGVALNTGKLPAPRDLPVHEARDEGYVPPDHRIREGVAAQTCTWCGQRFAVAAGGHLVCPRCADLEADYTDAVGHLHRNGLRPLDRSLHGDSDVEVEQRRKADYSLSRLMGFRPDYEAEAPQSADSGPLARIQAANQQRAQAHRDEAAAGARRARGQASRARAQASKSALNGAARRRAHIQGEIDRQLSLGADRTAVGQACLAVLRQKLREA